MFDLCSKTPFIHHRNIEITSIDVEDFLKTDPYLSKVPVNQLNYNKGSILLHNKILSKNQLFSDHIVDRHADMTICSHLSVIDKDIIVPSISKDGDTISIISPPERKEISKDLFFLNGDVVCFGLGLGYLPYLASLKSNVKSVTIVEDCQDNIDIFNELICPYLNCNMKIIKDNKLELFSDYQFMKNFDSSFIDCPNPSQLVNDFITMLEIQYKNKYKIPIRYKLKDIIMDIIKVDVYFYLLDVYNQKADCKLDLKNGRTWKEQLLELDDEKYHKNILSKIDNYFKSNKLKVQTIKDLTNFILDNRNISNIIVKS
jgi:hypothetical protein